MGKNGKDAREIIDNIIGHVLNAGKKLLKLLQIAGIKLLRKIQISLYKLLRNGTKKRQVRPAYDDPRDRYAGLSEEERRARIIAKKKAAYLARKRRIVWRNRLIFAGIIALIVIVIAGATVHHVKKKRAAEAAYAIAQQEKKAAEDAADAVIAEADLLAAQYDYDGAIDRIEQEMGTADASSDENADSSATEEKSSASDESDSSSVEEKDTSSSNDYSEEINAKYEKAITGYQEQKDACVACDVDKVPHIFFHSLINDSRGFDSNICGEFVAQDNACWMCSTDEFTTVLQQMYDDGYVIVSLHDLVTETTDSDGNVTFAKNENLMLPEGKKPFVFSEDDLSYYHSYEGQGIASKLVLDDNGEVKCEFVDENGETQVGDYDCIPLLNAFIKEHPDFSYHGAKIMIALTGYNGVLGYRTDTVYDTRDADRLDSDQKEFLEENPDFDYDAEVAAAKEVAQALKDDGYEFASHTWGHRHADEASVSSLKEDNERWVESVEPIVGEVDTIIFAHGNDISSSSDYSSDNEKYRYYKKAGYNFFCTVDASTAYTLKVHKHYVHQGRINIDGLFLYKAMNGDKKAVKVCKTLGIHDIKTFFDEARETPVTIPDSE